MKTHIHIPKPCHENWDAMTSEEKGRHCTKCEKTVFDVSTWTDLEINKTYTDNDQNMCIRIPEERLSPTPIPMSRTKRWKYYVAAGIASFWFMFKANNASAQSDSTAHSQEPDTLASDNKIAKMTITGVVRDSLNSKTGMPFADVMLKINGEAVIRVTTDENGKFQIDWNDSISLNDTFQLNVDYVGYTSVVKEFTPRDSIMSEIYLEEAHICLNEKVIVVGRREREYFAGAPYITMGVMVTSSGWKTIKRPMLDEFDTKTYHHDDLERYNLGR